MPISKKIMVICQDNELAYTVKQILENQKLTVITAKNHLQGIAILDKTNVEIIIAPVFQTNMDGLEFAKFLRTKEDNQLIPKRYLILFGDEDSRDKVFQSTLNIDDFLIYPFYEAELLWRVKRGINLIDQMEFLFQRLSIDSNTNTLTTDGFYIVLESEINRISRHTKDFSLLLIYINNLEDIVINYGKDWRTWIEKSFLTHLKKNLRNYDQLCRLEPNKFVILVPDANYNSLKGLDNRLKKEYENFFLELKNMGLTEDLKIVHRGISIKMIQNMDKRNEVLAFVKEWLTKEKTKDAQEDEFVLCTFSDFGPEVEYV